MGEQQIGESVNSIEGMSEAMRSAKLIGWNQSGEMCVWFGGYSFSVFNAVTDWSEKRHFTSGKISGLSNKDSDRGRELAIERMEMEGFTVIK